MKYMFIENHSRAFRVKKMCRCLGVSRSGYYAYKRRPVSKRQRANERLLVEIRTIYRKNRGVYGSPRIARQLRDGKFKCGKNRVARLMRINGIFAKTKRRFKVTTNSRHKYPVSENLINRQFKAAVPNRLWVSDITYIWTDEGWLYLSVILDLYSRMIVGWAFEDRQNTGLVKKAFLRAIVRRKPTRGLILHSDRGVQYASDDFRKALKQYGVIPSMSKKGDCYDNAVAESFFHTLKTELVYHEKYKSKAQAKSSIFEYIEVFYNRRRKHSAIEYLCPVDYERRFGVS